MSIRVLIADDHAVVRDGLRLILEAQPGITVVGVVADGIQAVQQVAELKPDVVIMDIAMPQLSGIEATEQIRQARPSTHIIILSMYSSKDHIIHALSAGARGYVLKESASEEIVTAVRRAYLGHHYLCKEIVNGIIDDFIAGRQAGQTTDRLSSLSRREQEVFKLIAKGKSIKEIALTLHVSPKSVDTYRRRLMVKLGIRDISSLMRWATQHGMTTPDESES